MNDLRFLLSFPVIFCEFSPILAEIPKIVSRMLLELCRESYERFKIFVIISCDILRVFAHHGRDSENHIWNASRVL